MSAKAAPANTTRVAASAMAKPRLTRPPKADATPERAPFAVQVTLDVQPLMEIVSRHVSLSRSARAGLRKDFLLALGHPPQVTTIAEPGAPALEVLSTEEAAQLVGVSRPYLVKQIELGRIPLHQKVGNQRRLLKRDVLAWQIRERRSQAAAFTKLAGELDTELFGS
ncbi:MAG TPA: helix-turn-helix domain-containing protein [Rhizobacter sp.]|nr:helix-turn-helix domain-containing protein [Rhizobacter sp.]